MNYASFFWGEIALACDHAVHKAAFVKLSVFKGEATDSLFDLIYEISFVEFPVFDVFREIKKVAWLFHWVIQLDVKELSFSVKFVFFELSLIDEAVLIEKEFTEAVHEVIIPFSIIDLAISVV